MDYKLVLLELIGSLTLCDHMGDVANDVTYVLEKLEMRDVLEQGSEDNDWWPGIAKGLHSHGIKTLYGTELM